MVAVTFHLEGYMNTEIILNMFFYKSWCLEQIDINLFITLLITISPDYVRLSDF